MAKQNVSVLTLEPRSAAGTTASNALRRAGKVPGVVYGHGESTPISVDVKELADLLHSRRRAHVIDAKVGGKADSLLLRHVDTHPVTNRPLSVDFQRVSKNESIVASVNVIPDGVPVGVRDQGGVMDLVAHTLDIKGPASAIPDGLGIDVRALTVHTHLTAADVTLPKGFTLITPPETIVVAVSLTRASAGTGEETPAEAVPAEAPAESG